MLAIKVPGQGCNNCKNVEAVARKAVAAMGLPAEITKLTEYSEIHKYPILSTRGLVINEKLVCAGRIPNEAEVTTWLANAEMPPSPPSSARWWKCWKRSNTPPTPPRCTGRNCLPSGKENAPHGIWIFTRYFRKRVCPGILVRSWLWRLADVDDLEVWAEVGQENFLQTRALDVGERNG